MTTTTTAAALAALRAKLTGPDPRDGVTVIDVKRRTRDVEMWPLRRDADAALRKLRASGLNVDKGVRVQRARTAFGRPFVITRLGDLGETLLMAADGSWVPGFLYPKRPGDNGAVWQPYEGAELIPAPFTHVVRTVRWSAARTERYRTKSNGSCGRWVWSDESVAVCTCGWKSYTATRPEAQADARVHRAKAAA